MKRASNFLVPKLFFLPVTPAIVVIFSVAMLSSAMAQMMVLPGKFNVSPQGAASFSVPIAVPPGTGGMVPSLSIDYTSGASNGLLGVGWGINGLPAITRCPQTLAQDGVRGSITYDVGVTAGSADNDRFCLNGQRLVAVSGVYGADGTQYRTELEGFSEIISHGYVGSSPAWFEVHTKSGQIMEFGDTADSREMFANTTAFPSARAWLVNLIADTTGNYMTVKYSVNPSGISGNSEVVPSEIDYTGNAAAAVVPYNKITFVYANNTRPDIVPLYTAGNLVETTQRLTDIETWYGTQSSPGSTEVNDYKFAYTASSSTGRSLLSTITMCDAADSNCLPARTFTYQADGILAGGLLPTANVNTNFDNLNGIYTSAYKIYPGDFGGTGQSGVLFLANGGGAVFINKAGSLSGTPISAAQMNQVSGLTPVIGDFNGDGKADVFWWSQSAPLTSSNYVWLSNGDGTFTVITNPLPVADIGNINGIPAVNKALVGDFNGDGKADLFFYYADSSGLVGYLSVPNYYYCTRGDCPTGETTMQIAMSNCSQTTCSFSPAQSPAYSWFHAIGVNYASYRPFIYDFNGDGKADIYWEPEDQYGRVNTAAGDTNATVWYGPIKFPSSGTYLDQLSVTGPSLYYISGSISSGAVTSQVMNTSIGAAQGDRPIFGDFNGDGLPDIFWDNEDTYDHSTATSQMLWLNEGNGAFQSTAIPSSLTSQVKYFKPYAADFNGDGMSDIFWDWENTDTGTYGQRALWVSTGSGFSVTADGGTTNVAGEDNNFTDTSDNWSSTAYHPIIGDFNGDGKAGILWDDYNSSGQTQGTRMLWSSDGVQPDLMTSLTNGLGTSSTMGTTTIDYGTVSEGFTSSAASAPASYTTGPFANYYAGWDSSTCTGVPASTNAIDIALPMPVVTSTSSSTGLGTGNPYESNFTYSCLRADTTGRGFLGFAQETVTDAQTGIVQTTNFRQDFPYIGLVSSATKKLGTVTLNHTENTYGVLTPTSTPTALPWSDTETAEVAPQFPYLSQSVVASNDLNGTPLPTATTTTTYDAYGNAQTVSTSKMLGTVQSSIQTTTNTYQAPDLTHWFLGRLTQSTVTSTTP